MQSQLPNQPTTSATVWGYRSHAVEAERAPGYIALDYPVYRLRFWGRRDGQALYLLQRAPVTCYRVVLN